MAGAEKRPGQRAARLRRAAKQTREARGAGRAAAPRAGGLGRRGAQPGALLVRRGCGRGPASASIPPPGPVRPGGLAQPAARPLAHLGPGRGAARRADHPRGDRPAVLRGLQPLLPGNDQTPGAGLLGSTCSPGRPTRPGCTGWTRGCTSPSASLCCRWCWPSCGRCSPACSPGPRSVRWPRSWSGSASSCWSAASFSSSPPGSSTSRTTTSSRSPFYTAHLCRARVFIAGFVIHVTLKFPRMVTGAALPQPAPGNAHPAGGDQAQEPEPRVPEPRAGAGACGSPPRAPTISRRGLLAAVGGVADPGRAGRRAVHRRVDPAHVPVRAARAVRDRPALPPGQPDRRRRSG